MKVEFLLDNEGVNGISVFEALKETVPKRWFRARVKIGAQEFDLSDHANDSVIAMMHAVTDARGSKERMSIDIPDDLIQGKRGDFQGRLLDAIIRNSLRETDLCEEESSSSTDGEQVLAPTGSLG